MPSPSSEQPAVVEELDLAHAAEPAAPPAGAGAVLEQLVLRDPQREVRLDVLDRVVARVGVERVDGVEAVLAVAAAVAALLDVHVDPVRPSREARVGDDLEVADARADALGQHRREGAHDACRR